MDVPTTTSTTNSCTLDPSFRDLQKRYDIVSAIALESAMLYHLEVLVGLFVVLGCFKSAGIGCLWNTGWWVMEGVQMMVTICLAAGTTYEVHWVTLVILVLVANFVLELLQFVLGTILPRLLFPASPDLSHQCYRIRFFALGLFLLLLGLQSVGKLFDWQTRLCLSLLGAIYIATINSAVAMASHRDGHRLLAFASTFFLVCPSVVAGKIMALVSTKNLTTIPGARDFPLEFRPSSGLWTLTLRMVLPIGLRLAWVHYQQKFNSTSSSAGRALEQPNKGDRVRASLMGLAILYAGPSLFQMGQSYRAGDLMAVISWIECVCLPFSSF